MYLSLFFGGVSLAGGPRRATATAGFSKRVLLGGQKSGSNETSHAGLGGVGASQMSVLSELVGVLLGTYS